MTHNVAMRHGILALGMCAALLLGSCRIYQSSQIPVTDDAAANAAASPAIEYVAMGEQPAPPQEEPVTLQQFAEQGGAFLVQQIDTFLPLLFTAPPTLTRGYTTTPDELQAIAAKARQGVQPYADAMSDVLEWAGKPWDYSLDATAKCGSSESPKWNDNDQGTPRLYARALAYHLTGEERYAREVKDILQQIMQEVQQISIDDTQCQLNFAWGAPELVASADLIDAYWRGMTCTGPTSMAYANTTLGAGPCKTLFQNWLVKNPYYISSYAAVGSKSNWGAAATNATAYIADYLADRPTVQLLHRHPRQVNNGQDLALTPRQAYAYANRLMFDRMNGYGIEYTSSESCDYLFGSQQHDDLPPVKSQITERGIIPEDARREEYCNIQTYNGEYQNYPQIHLGHNIQQCELMLRRGSRSCYDNVDNTDLPSYMFVDPSGANRATALRPGRGSIERAINAVIIDAGTEWRHDAALEVAYRYYVRYHRLDGVEQWVGEIDQFEACSQNVCFATLTHSFTPGEMPALPPTVSPP